MQGGHQHVIKKDLLCFVTKQGQGLSDGFPRIIFLHGTRHATSLTVATVRESLMQRFTDENIRFQYITRQEYLDRHVDNFSIVYINCTYADIEKVLLFQRITFVLLPS